MTIEQLDNQIDRTTTIVESCHNPDLRDHYINERRKLGEKKLNLLGTMMEDAWNKSAEGLITEAAADQITEELQGQIDATKVVIYPWYEAAAIASGLNMAIKEVAAIRGAVGNGFVANTIGKGLSKPARAFISARLKRYPLLHPEAVEFGQLDSEVYDIQEMDKLGIKFKNALKWLEKGVTRVHVKVFSYRKQPVMAIAYSKDLHAGMGMSSLIEPMVISGSFKKDEDYYIACMCTNVQLTHPATKRVIDKLSKEWEKKKKEMEKVVKESAENAEADGTLDEKIRLVTEAAENGEISKESADRYSLLMRRASLYTGDDINVEDFI